MLGRRVHSRCNRHRLRDATGAAGLDGVTRSQRNSLPAISIAAATYQQLQPSHPPEVRVDHADGLRKGAGPVVQALRPAVAARQDACQHDVCIGQQILEGVQRLQDPVMCVVKEGGWTALMTHLGAQGQHSAHCTPRPASVLSALASLAGHSPQRHPRHSPDQQLFSFPRVGCICCR